MRYVIARFLTIATLFAGCAAGAGDIYCNNQGHDCSDRPTPGATIVRSTAPAPTPEPSSAAETTTTPIDAAANDRIAQDANRQAVQKDVAATRAAQCKDAREKYQKTIEARRVYRLNKAGEREYLTDAEADQMRLAAHDDMEQACGKTPP